MDKKHEFSLKLLGEMARMTKTEVTPFTLELYEESLAPLGWDVVSEVLKQMFQNLRKFPTIQDIKTELGISTPKAPDEKDEAQAIAGQIISAISEFGYYRELDAKAKIGDFGWLVVKSFGGWPYLCDIQTDDIPTVRAQLRDLAVSIRRTNYLQNNQLKISSKGNFDIQGLISEVSRGFEMPN